MAETESYDYSEFTDVKASEGSNALAVLSMLAQEQLDAEAVVARCQAELTKAQEKLKDVSERRLPEMMEEIGMADFRTITGLRVVLDQNIRASVPKNFREQAWAWMRANGNAALIKRKVIVEFGKGEDDKAQKLAEALIKDYDLVTDESGVHPSTLAAFVRDQLAKGKDVPLDVFGVFKQRVSKIQRPA